MSNNEIMKKYELSAKGLRSLFDKLLTANLLSRAEYHHRVAEQPVESTNERTG